MTTAMRNLFLHLDTPFTGQELFDCLADVVYFVKNERAQYVVVNRTLAERLGVSDREAVLGRTAEEVFPQPLGRAYREQDENLLRTGKPVSDQLELHLYPSGRTGWCMTNKFPLRSGGKLVGLVGISHDLLEPGESADGYRSVADAVRYAQAHLDQRLVLENLASVANLSVYQFDRRIRRLFRLTAGQLLHKLRMDEAIRRLADTDDQILNIALACGYTDPSAFARQFKLTTGLSPRRYRLRAQDSRVNREAKPIGE